MTTWRGESRPHGRSLAVEEDRGRKDPFEDMTGFEEQKEDKEKKILLNLLLRLARSSATVKKLIARCREIADALSNDDTESIPEPLERRRRRSTSN
ncbi:hypothetical protein PRIPAC_87641 [Pristionchus pacificus]|uniref:Uncharacterized protein n=1 Tax=Pristionchus pacificus TaxID=54126 RepID=A0A2A6B7W2_PRIPA|nr:hypothetical protein PRIPAC_87641 [Pristionchus pacificus]|eukprot:PDM61970.1 hypothetical protein PRIPAC_51412 [Pristionchus pacificus]